MLHCSTIQWQHNLLEFYFAHTTRKSIRNKFFWDLDAKQYLGTFLSINIRFRARMTMQILGFTKFNFGRFWYFAFSILLYFHSHFLLLLYINLKTCPFYGIEIFPYGLMLIMCYTVHTNIATFRRITPEYNSV